MAIMLLFARSHLKPFSVRVELRCYLHCITLPSLACHASAPFSPAAGREDMESGGFDPGGTYQEEQKQVEENALDTNPTHKLARQPSRLIDQYKPALADPGLGTLDAGMQDRIGEEDRTSGVWLARAGENIRLFCKHGQVDRAIDVIDQKGVVPSVEMYTAVLKACSKSKAPNQAQRVHASLVRHGLDTTRFLGELMVSTLVKCGSFLDALQLHHKLPERTVFSWTALISGYISLGRIEHALDVYRAMKAEGVKPNSYTFVSLLKACGSIGDLKGVRHLHAEALEYDFTTDVFVGTCLVDIYGKWGCISEARKVFDGLSARNVVSWTAMISAYAHHGKLEEVARLYAEMHREGASPDERTIVTVLQACARWAEMQDPCSRAKVLQLGRAVHSDAWRKGYDSDAFVGSAAVSMYVMCGSFDEAENVVLGVANLNVVAWTVLLMAYTQHGQPGKALQLYEQMQEHGISPDARTFVGVLQACSMLAEKEGAIELGESTISVQSLEKGRAMHAAARREGLEADLFVGNTLVSMYGKCGSTLDAQHVFDGLTQRDTVSWNALMSAFVEHGRADKALELYEQMCSEGESPDLGTFVITIQACGKLAAVEHGVNAERQFLKVETLARGRTLHSFVAGKACASDTYINNTLVSMYGSCGSLLDAEAVFDGLFESTVVSWNAMLAAYVQHEKAERALGLYERMLVDGVSPNVWTFVSVLQACAMLACKDELANRLSKVRALVLGKAIHADACMTGCQLDPVLGTSLMGMYAMCCSTEDARHVFDGLSKKNVVAWTALLAAYVQNGQAYEALELYEQMPAQGISLDIYSHVVALQACGMLAEKDGHFANGRYGTEWSLNRGRAIHADAKRQGYGSDLFLINTLISMYGKCGSIVDAQNVFHGLSQRDVVSWNAMLSAYVEQGQAEEALQLYDQMKEKGVGASLRTFVSALQACCLLAAKEENVVNQHHHTRFILEKGMSIHAHARKEGCDSNVFVCNTLINMYGKCGNFVDAEGLFYGMSNRNVLSWNLMFAICTQQGQGEKVLQLYEQAKLACVSLDEAATVCILWACSSVGSLDVCRQIHGNLKATPTEWRPTLAKSFINTYARCGSMADAQAVFDELPQPDVISWTALIAGYARHGNHRVSLRCYEELQLAGLKPDTVTFLSVLSACSHAGLVDRGVEYFESMVRDHNISPEIEHYVSMVDLLGRAGYFTVVEDLLSSMPAQPNLALWLCLLSACRKHSNIELGQMAFDCAVALQPQHAAAYFLLSSIYVDVGLRDQAVAVKHSLQSSWKGPAHTWIDHEHELNTFLAGNCNDKQLSSVLDIIKSTEILWELG